MAGPEATLSSIPLALLRSVRGNYVRTRVNDYMLKIDLRDTVVSFQLLFQRRYEPTQTALFRRLTRPGDWVLDVGGHIGYYAVLFGSIVGPLGRVTAIEPNPDNALLLRENVSLNRLDQIVTVVEGAAGAAPGTATLYRPRVGNRGDSRLFDDPTNHGARREQVIVPMTTLDECTQTWPRVDLVKMDVQGYELQVLTGMRRVLASNPELILVIELWPWGLRRAGTDPHELLAKLTGFGFSLWEVPEEESVRPVAADIVSHLEANNAFTNILCARADQNRHRLQAASIPVGP
jgi:FkbM family methyltransferase